MNMNPSIPEPSRRFVTRYGLPVAIIAITFMILGFASWKLIRKTHPVEAVTVVMRDVETTEPTSTEASSGSIVQAPGWVEASPYAIYAGALIQGIVEEILVLEGDYVEEGQPVATLISEDNELALTVAKSKVSLRKGELRAAQTQMEERADEYERKKPLVESGTLAEGPVERLRLRLLNDEAKIEIAKASVDTAVAEHAIAKLALERCIVRSPIDGIVIERLTSPGSVIRFTGGEHASHILHLYDPNYLQVRADIPLADAATVGVGHPAEIIVDILPNTIFKGEIIRFVHKADQQKNTIEAKVIIRNPSDLLKPDMLARVKILQPDQPAGTKKTWTEQRVFIPKNVIADMNNPSVWVIANLHRGIGNAEKRNITLGTQEFDGWIEVLSGLSAGDSVITSEITFVSGDVVAIKEGE
jgi:RND family efflux transporter MFP subunit